MLLALAKRGWEVTTFCGCGLDFQHATNPLQLLADRNIVPQQIVRNQGSVPFSLVHFHDEGLKSAVFLPEAMGESNEDAQGKGYNRPR